MAGIAKQAVVVSLSRFANYGLLLISPIVLVRLLTIGEFGRYREFLVYSSVLASIAAFSIPNSLLYFVPADPARSWQYVRQTVQLTALTSIAAVLCIVIADLVSGGRVVGQQLWPVAIYVLVFVNIDFWEYLWLATQRPIAVFAYTSGRLVSRMLVVITLAYLFHRVAIVLWGLVAAGERPARRVGGRLETGRPENRNANAPARRLAANGVFLPADRADRIS